MQITIGRNTATTGYHAIALGTYRYGETRGEALGRLIMAHPELLAKGVTVAHEDDPREKPPTIEVDRDSDSIVRELAEASTIGEPEPHPELDQACKDALRDREIATALSGRPLVPGAAAQLLKLWRDRFVVVEGESEYKVTTEYGHTPGTILPEWLKLPKYAHFLIPIPAARHCGCHSVNPVLPCPSDYHGIGDC